MKNDFKKARQDVINEKNKIRILIEKEEKIEYNELYMQSMAIDEVVKKYLKANNI